MSHITHWICLFNVTFSRLPLVKSGCTWQLLYYVCAAHRIFFECVFEFWNNSNARLTSIKQSLRYTKCNTDFKWLFLCHICSPFLGAHLLMNGIFFVDFMLFDWLMISSSDLLISWYEILDSRCERIQLDALKIAQTTLFISTNRLRIYLCAWKFTSVDKIIHQHRFQLNAIRSLAHAVRVNSWIRQIHEHSSVFFSVSS